MEEYEEFQLPDDAREIFESYDIPVSAIDDSEPASTEPDLDDSVAITAPPDYDSEPLHDWDAALANFPGDETVLDMPQEEQTQAMAEVERFAVAGDEQVGRYRIHSVPRDALEAEGLDYDVVEAVLQEPSDDDPYAVGLTATRIVTVEVEGHSTEGQEKKTVTFANAADGSPQAQADGELIAGDTSYAMEEAPLLRLDEVRGILRAIGRAVA